MKYAAFIASLIILSSAASAQFTLNLTSLFSEGGVIGPPALPQQEERSELALRLVDLDKKPVNNSHVTLILEAGGRRETTLRYSDGNGTVYVSLESGRWTITAKADYFNTLGKDLVSEAHIVEVDGAAEAEVLMLPAGSVRGSVRNQRGERVAGAQVRVDCGRAYGDSQASSNEVGDFSLSYVPAGVCEVSALFGGRVGSARVEVAAGGMAEADILLDEGMQQADDILPYILALILAAAVILFVVLRRRPEAKPAAAEKIEVTERMRDIMQSLSERERKIVEAMVERGGRLTQAGIRHVLDIPKATASRDMYSLEQKKIVETVRVGRNKEITLTRWFLRGEK
jgi:uncharacterized membrane protein